MHCVVQHHRVTTDGTIYWNITKHSHILQNVFVAKCSSAAKLSMAALSKAAKNLSMEQQQDTCHRLAYQHHKIMIQQAFLLLIYGNRRILFYFFQLCSPTQQKFATYVYYRVHGACLWKLLLYILFPAVWTGFSNNLAQQNTSNNVTRFVMYIVYEWKRD